jgi:hypothetical protein
MSRTYAGGCACGAIRYQISAEPVMSVQCQCRDCQRATGTGHANALAFPAAAVTVTGEPKFHQVRGDSGNTVERGFCPQCGSPVLWTFSRNRDAVAVMAGSLDDPSQFAPKMAFFTSRGHAWDRLDPDLPKFDKLP